MTRVALARAAAPADRDEVVALLHRVVAELEELRAAVAPELAERAAVLAALREAFGEAAFTAEDACGHAAESPGSRAARD